MVELLLHLKIFLPKSTSRNPNLSLVIRYTLSVLVLAHLAEVLDFLSLLSLFLDPAQTADQQQKESTLTEIVADVY